MAGLFDGFLPGLVGGNNGNTNNNNNDNDNQNNAPQRPPATTPAAPAKDDNGGFLGGLFPGIGGGNTNDEPTTPKPSTVASAGPPTQNTPKPTNTKPADNTQPTSPPAQPTPSTPQTTAQQPTTKPAEPTTAPAPTTNQPPPTTMVTMPAPTTTEPEQPPAVDTATSVVEVPASTPAADPAISGTPTAVPAANSTNGQQTIAGLPKSTAIGIGCGVAGLVVLILIIFSLRRVLRNRREGNQQVLDRLDLTIGTSEAPVGSGKNGNMTRSMEDLNRQWNAGLEQYHQPTRQEAKGMGYSM